MEDKLLNKKMKKIKKYVKKEWNIDHITIKPEDTLINVAERVAMISEDCNLEEVYKKWILRNNMHLPGWIAYIIALDNSKRPDKVDLNTQMRDL